MCQAMNSVRSRRSTYSCTFKSVVFIHPKCRFIWFGKTSRLGFLEPQHKLEKLSLGGYLLNQKISLAPESDSEWSTLTTVFTILVEDVFMLALSEVKKIKVFWQQSGQSNHFGLILQAGSHGMAQTAATKKTKVYCTGGIRWKRLLG